jgi:hypothetical protein
MAVDIGQIRKGMRVHASDGTDLGKVTEVWLGTDPKAAHARCDEEVCSRIEVHRRERLFRDVVLYVPYSAIAAVSGKDVVLYVDAQTAGAKGWSRKPAWLPGEIEVLPGRRHETPPGP